MATTVVGVLCLTPTIAIAQGLATIDAILRAHNAWPVTPASIVMTGTSSKTGPDVIFKATGTRLQETIVEYGEKKQVTTATSAVFNDDGKKSQYAPAPSGFSQLDLTGLFMVAQLRQRAVQVAEPEKTTIRGVPGYRIHVSEKRSQVHFGLARVTDEFDLYVTEAGLLLGISRLYYDDQPFRYTQTYLFSDYREIADKLLLPFRIEVYLKGRLTETIEVASYEFGVPTPSSLFQPRRSR